MLREVYRHYSLPLARALGRAVVSAGDGGTVCVGGRLAPFDLDDIVQETFVRAFTEPVRKSYDGVRPFAGYLYVIGHNLLVDRLRVERRRAAKLNEATPDVSLMERATADVELESS